MHPVFYLVHMAAQLQEWGLAPTTQPGRQMEVCKIKYLESNLGEGAGLRYLDPSHKFDIEKCSALIQDLYL